MHNGVKMLFGIAVGTVLLGAATPFAWADGGGPAGVAAMRSAWLGTACRVTEA